MIEKASTISTIFILTTVMFAAPAYSFEVESIDIVLQDAQVLEYETYDVLIALFYFFNGGTQTAQLEGHSMLYLNDTNSDYWEYTSYLDLDELSESDCPFLNTSVASEQSENIQLCYILPKDHTIGYSIVVNNDKYFMDMDTKEFVLESVPSWFTTTTADWCNDTITDSDFVNSTQSYISDGTIKVLRGQSGTDIGEPIPFWVKDNSCLWSDSQISDYEFLDAIYWLIDNGKIQL